MASLFVGQATAPTAKTVQEVAILIQNTDWSILLLLTIRSALRCPIRRGLLPRVPVAPAVVRRSTAGWPSSSSTTTGRGGSGPSSGWRARSCTLRTRRPRSRIRSCSPTRSDEEPDSSPDSSLRGPGHDAREHPSARQPESMKRTQHRHSTVTARSQHGHSTATTLENTLLLANPKR